MTADEIRQLRPDEREPIELAKGIFLVLREIAAHIAEMNERSKKQA